MYSCVFIGNILDFYMNHSFGNIHLIFQSCQIHLFVLLLILFIAGCYDLKFGIIPNKLSFILFVYGLVFNSILSILLDNPFIFLFSIALTAFITAISFVLWYIGFWGGGDFKIFIGLSLALSFLDLNHIHLDYFLNSSFPASNQFIFYPKSISILLNAILIALALILIKILYEIVKSKWIKYFSILVVMDTKSAFSLITTKTVDINSLDEGMVLEEYYFKSKVAYDTIINEKNKNCVNLNLNAFKEDDYYSFSSLNSIGLTKGDIGLIKDLYEKNLIKNSDFNIKIGIPFMPFITLGYLGFLAFGDFIAIISSFMKMLF